MRSATDAGTDDMRVHADARHSGMREVFTVTVVGCLSWTIGPEML